MCAVTPAADPGTPVRQASSSSNFWYPRAANPTGEYSLTASTPTLAVGDYVLCAWSGPSSALYADLYNIDVTTSAAFTVSSPPIPPTAPVVIPLSPATPTRLSLPRNFSSPALTGKLRTGGLLHCSKGLWDIRPKISNYQWFRGATQIADASYPSYRVKKIDAGRRIRCAVVITYGDGRSTSKASAAHTIAKLRKPA
jgi:hypothetical protein